jgi:DNA repair protein RecN (Recombination protein N)
VLDSLAQRLEEVSASVAELGADLAGYADGLAADPEQLATAQARVAILTGLRRKYGDELIEVLQWRTDAQQRLADLDVSDEALAALRAELETAAAQTAKLALELSTARATAADLLGTSVTTELAGLAMPSARVRIAVSHRPSVTGSPSLTIKGANVGVGIDGIDEVDFLLRPHPDAPELSIQRGASGGELSRIMLAIEVSLAGTNPVPTMVFDEVDAGVGGRAAVEVGRRLARLAGAHQVIVVTHLAQVAAYADRHIVVDKPLESSSSGVTRSDVRVVEDDQRLAELARMLGGNDSATAREHAAELLAAARRDRADEVPSSGPAKPKRAARPRGGTGGRRGVVAP